MAAKPSRKTKKSWLWTRLKSITPCGVTKPSYGLKPVSRVLPLISGTPSPQFSKSNEFKTCRSMICRFYFFQILPNSSEKTASFQLSQKLNEQSEMSILSIYCGLKSFIILRVHLRGLLFLCLSFSRKPMYYCIRQLS